MIIRNYSDDPSSFKLAWLNENNPKSVTIDFPDFKSKVITSGNENPKSNGWYEHNDKKKRFVLTEDTSVLPNKNYYQIGSLSYDYSEIVNSDFSLKKTIQNGDKIDFIGCSSTTLEFSVANDFKYLVDQKITATLSVFEKSGNQRISTIFGIFEVGSVGQIQGGFDVTNSKYRNELHKFDPYDPTFIVNEGQHSITLNGSQSYIDYCVDNNDGVALRTAVDIPFLAGDIQWNIKVFTGLVDEVTRDKSRELTRKITAHDYMYRLLDNYDVTDWYVWQYGDEKQDEDSKSNKKDENVLKKTVLELRNSFWKYISESGTEYSPNGTAIAKKGEGWTQKTQTLINDNKQIPKTLNVAPVDFDEYVSGALVGGPFKRNPKDKTDPTQGTQYDIYTISSNWDVSDLVARKQIIELGVIGTLFIYNSKTVYFREYLADCDRLKESSGNDNCGISAQIKIPREEQDKLRETQITASTVMQSICQINGTFGQFNGDGEFEYISLDTLNPEEIADEYQISVGYSDTKFPNITGVVIFDKTSEEYSDDQIHTEYGDVKNGKKGSALAYYPDDRTKIEGDEAHVFTIDDNFLMNSYEQKDAIEIAKNLYNHISAITMRNAKLEIKAMPWLQCGQSITYYAPTEDTLYPAKDLYPSSNLYPSGYQKIVSVIMSYGIKIKGAGLFQADIECKVEDMSCDIVDLNEIISAEMFSRKIGDNKAYSQISQTADKIEMKVADDIEKISSSITMLKDSITAEVDGPNGLKSMIKMTQTDILLLSSKITLEAKRIDLIASESINIKTRLFQLEADEAVINATKVSFVDLKTGGKTVINGANIMTGSISCDRIKLTRMTVGNKTYDVNWTEKRVYNIEGYTELKRLGFTISNGHYTVDTQEKYFMDTILKIVTDSDGVHLAVLNKSTSQYEIVDQVPIIRVLYIDTSTDTENVTDDKNRAMGGTSHQEGTYQNRYGIPYLYGSEENVSNRFHNELFLSGSEEI